MSIANKYYSFLFLLFYLPVQSQNSCVAIANSADKTNMNEAITFISKSNSTCKECDSSFQAKAYLWKFPGAEPATALGPGPHEVRYFLPGNFEVELEVTYIHPVDFEQECKKSITNKIFIEGEKVFTLKSFNVKASNNRIVLDWTTVFDDAIPLFTVEKSTDTSNFSEIATVKTDSGNSISNYYSTDDKTPTKGLSFYRLKYKEASGKINYSNAVAVKWININELLNIGDGEKVLVVINDKDGNEIYSKVVVKGMENDAIVAIDPLQKISPGTYHIVGSSKNEIHDKQLIVREEK